MATDWISAERAIKIFSVVWKQKEAREALIRCAGGAMIRTRAKQFTSPHVAQINYDIPVGFWVSPKLTVLSWETSDFALDLDSNYPTHAFHVMFDREGVIASLPIEKRGEGSRAGSIAANPNFISAREAVALVYSTTPLVHNVTNIILDYCRSGHIHGAALLMQYSGYGKTGPWDMENSEWEIAPFFWQRCTSPNYSSRDWDAGVFEGSYTNSHSREWFRLTGVHFVKSSLAVIIPSILEVTAKAEGAPVNNEDLPPLAEAKLNAWWRGKEAIADSLTEEELLTLVRAKFPENYISRARIRKFTSGRMQGRKPIRQKDTAN